MITSAIQRHGFISERLPAKTGNVSNTYELHFVTYVTRPYTRDPFTTMEEKFSIRSSVYLLRFFSIRTDHLFFLFLFFFLQVSASRYPVVVKLGHAHGGVGKARAETNQEFLDLASLAALANAYCTSEPYVDTKYDVHVQKIGNNYKAFM